MIFNVKRRGCIKNNFSSGKAHVRLGGHPSKAISCGLKLSLE